MPEVSWGVVTPPAVEPVSIELARLHCRVGTELDETLELYIASARTHIEEICGVSLITQARYLERPEFADTMTLPRGPVQSVSAVKYYAEDGTLTTLSSAVYETDLRADPPYVRLRDGQSWPTTDVRAGAVRIEYTAGYGDEPEDVPAPLRNAVLLLTADAVESPGELVIGTAPSRTGGLSALIAPYVRRWVP